MDDGFEEVAGAAAPKPLGRTVSRLPEDIYHRVFGYLVVDELFVVGTAARTFAANLAKAGQAGRQRRSRRQ